MDLTRPNLTSISISGDTFNIQPELFTRRTDLFLGAEGTPDSALLEVADERPNTSANRVSITWTPYTTRNVVYYFVEGIGIPEDGDVVWYEGDGFWTTINPALHVGLGVDPLINVINETNSANLIG